MYKINVEDYFKEIDSIAKTYNWETLFGDFSKCCGDKTCDSTCEKPVGKNPSVIDNQDTKTVITTDLPGYKKEGIKITTTSKVLSVVVEGTRGKKTYNYTLTDIADYQKISSKFEDGVLTIEVPNKAEATPVEIKVW